VTIAAFIESVPDRQLHDVIKALQTDMNPPWEGVIIP
jgi:hypothetical protein